MGIKFFRKNILDLSNELPSITVSDLVADDTGEDFVDLMRNRDNSSGWMTTGSDDTGATTMVVDFGETRSFDRILLVGHNLKSYTLKYWNGSAWANFSTAIAPTTNTATTTYHTFTEVSTDQLQLVMNSTMVADEEKYIRQFIVTEILGEFSVEPEVQPQFDKDRKTTRFISGRSYVAKSVGGFNCRIRMRSMSVEADLALIETLFSSYEGFLVWLCGGDITQFETVRQGYRLEDIFLMDVSNEYQPEFLDSRWANGLGVDLRLVEVTS